MVTLAVKNAFNSTKWIKIKRIDFKQPKTNFFDESHPGIETEKLIPKRPSFRQHLCGSNEPTGYFARSVDSNFSVKLPWFKTDDRSKEYIVTAGVPQDLYLWSLLRSVMYDGVLDLRVSEKATMIGFADDGSETTHPIKSWLQMAK